MLADPDVSCRGLREKSEGCEFLINEWSSLKPTLIDPVHWDGPDERLALALMGALRVCRKQNPSPLAMATKAIRVHRELAERLELNASGRAITGSSTAASRNMSTTENVWITWRWGRSRARWSSRR